MKPLQLFVGKQVGIEKRSEKNHKFAVPISIVYLYNHNNIDFGF